MTNRSPEYRFGGHFSERPSARGGRMHVDISRVDGLPARDAYGQPLCQHGLTLDELLAELRLLITRLRAYDDPEPEPAPAQLASGRTLVFLSGHFTGWDDDVPPGSVEL